MQPTVSVDAQDLARLSRTIEETIAVSKKSVSGAMIQASVFASQSAAGAVYGESNSGRSRRQGKKNRESRKHKRVAQSRGERGRFLPGQSTMGKNGIPWWSIGSVDIWTKGKKKTTHFRTAAAFNKAKPVPRRGLGGNVWRMTAAKSAGAMSDASLARKFSTTEITKVGDLISGIKMTNSLDYISKVAPQSAAVGVRNAEARLRGILNRDLARKIEKAFQQRSR